MYAIVNDPESEGAKDSRIDIYLALILLILDGILAFRLGWHAFDDVETPNIIKYFWIIFAVAVVVVPFISLYIFPNVRRRVLKKKV